MRILVVTDICLPEPSPAAAHVFDRAACWAAEGHEVTILTNHPNYPEGRFHPEYGNRWRTTEHIRGVRIVRVKTYATSNQGVLRRLVDYLSFVASASIAGLFEARPSVVFSTTPHLFTPLAATWIASCRGVPHVMEVRDLWPESILHQGSPSYALLERLELWLYRRATRVIVLTASFKESLVSRSIGPDSIDIVRGSAALDIFSPASGRDAALEEALGLRNRFAIGYPGTLATAHDLDVLLAAADALRRTPACFVIVGGGPVKAELEGRARAAGLGEQFRFLPARPRDAMPACWSLFDLSLALLRNAPALARVVPSKILESMACGVPVVFVGPEGEGSELVRREDVGVVVPAGDGAALAAAVIALMNDSTLRLRLAANGRTAASRWSRTRHATETLEVLHRAAALSAPCTSSADCASGPASPAGA